MSEMLHVICERDVGLFSLIQQVIAQIPWALAEKRIPIAFFAGRCCYWTSDGYADRDTVWEYYFEPVMPGYTARYIPDGVRSDVIEHPPDPRSPGYRLNEQVFVSCHFGDHPGLKGKTLRIPYLWDDPDDALRQRVGPIIRDHVRPRPYIQSKVNAFFDRHMKGRQVIGVHVRGTDAVSRQETRAHRYGSLVLENYGEAIGKLLKDMPDALVLVATDAQSSLDYIKGRFQDRVLAYASLRHEGGEATGSGPQGWAIPAYIATDRNRAARNGEEAVIEYLLLSRCQHLVHNGSGLARTVLLASPGMSHTNTHRKNRMLAHVQSFTPRKVMNALRALQRNAGRMRRP